MKIYQLSQLGKRVARSTSAANTSNWRVIYALDRLDYATPDQIALQTGLEEGEVAGAMMILKRRRIVEER